MLLAADYALGEVIWTIFIVFMWVIWLWLLFTAEDSVSAEDHQWAQDRSKSANRAVGPDRSSPMLVTHSSQK